MSKNVCPEGQILKFFSNAISIRYLVEVNGFEPMTSCVQGRRSPS